MNYNHLHYFYTVAKSGSVSKAAEILKIQQPSLSAQLKTFEGQLNVKLFEKVGRHLQLSVQGQVVYRYCQRIFEAAADLNKHLAGGTISTEERVLKIGVTEQIDQLFVADLISHVLTFSASRQFRLKVVSGSHGELVQKTKNSELDLIFTNSPVLDSALTGVIDLKMPVGLFLSKDLLREKKIKDKLSLKSWFKETSLGLILPSEGLKLRHETEHFLQKYQLKTTVIFESDLLPVVSRAVTEGIGFCFLPIPYMIEEMKHGLVELLSSSQGLWSHQLFLTSRRAEQSESSILKIKKSLEHLRKGQRF